ncbi:oxidoreductase-like protein [Xylariaceae sp. FL0255]|nr:oxidoreductase-like protein [Xylariaceae sp. FL0255]
MPLSIRPFIRAARLQSSMSRNANIQNQVPCAFASTSSKLPGGTLGESGSSEQAAPIGPYYEAILYKPQPIPEVKPEEPPASSPKSPAPLASATSSSSSSNGTTTKKGKGKKAQENSAAAKGITFNYTSQPATAEEKTRFTIGSRLAGPEHNISSGSADSLQNNSLQNKSKMVAGVLVPPRPEEPLNCCMSGCVDCVWERYRDEMEGWAAANARAERALGEQSEPQQSSPVKTGAPVPPPLSDMSMDDDGGGSETNWDLDVINKQREKGKKKTDAKITKDFWDDDLYKNVPVGIREFMKYEKKLRDQKQKEKERRGTCL